jgi:acetylornithine deacetylase
MARANVSEDERRAIAAKVDEQTDALVECLSELVSIRSVNPVFQHSEPLEEERCQRFLAARLEDLGFETDLWEPDPEELKQYRGKPGYQENRHFEKRPNLAATLRGRGAGRSVMLASHIDVVGVSESEDWEVDPFGGEIVDGRVYGRGAADMKGGVACMLAATEALLDLGLRPGGDVVWASVVDEETGGMGTLALVHRGYRADAAFMPEPTGTRIVPMCRGILWGEISITEALEESQESFSASLVFRRKDPSAGRGYAWCRCHVNEETRS